VSVCRPVVSVETPRIAVPVLSRLTVPSAVPSAKNVIVPVAAEGPVSTTPAVNVTCTPCAAGLGEASNFTTDEIVCDHAPGARTPNNRRVRPASLRMYVARAPNLIPHLRIKRRIRWARRAPGPRREPNPTASSIATIPKKSFNRPLLLPLPRPLL
jgi:hypothetical protein